MGSQRYTLCNTDDIPDPGSMGFEIDHAGDTVELFVVNQHGDFFGYINSCPHTGANLEWQEHQFLDMDNAFIQCSTHDALFEIPTGLCVKGPCAGEHLSPVTLLRQDGELSVELGR